MRKGYISADVYNMKHNLGTWLSAWFGLFDALIKIFTFGIVKSSFEFMVITKRLRRQRDRIRNIER